MDRFARLLSTPGWAQELMTGIYHEVVTDPVAVAQLGRGLRIVADAPGAVVVHCSAGKDRTGLLVAIAALLAGASPEAVEADFVYSNHASSSQRAVVPSVPGLDPALLDPLLGVDVTALRSALAAVQDAHGSLETFAATAGLDAPTLSRLEQRLRPEV
ncbi:hypothetical protein C8046_02450 [Serinibacter arcticus]|uniref:Tyrosine specific protein phosphatases domain-containing protein n=1 Tax=Serinibacter arcticus TaxID=1655435 RepID=A0A2U1ZS34_9MICO|nr:tyrosine-protein phosphatase [Serinibacter arcticus]PWD49732.1 hypothetical protein C8046_02450 [Serinibacter arcticus]